MTEPTSPSLYRATPRTRTLVPTGVNAALEAQADALLSASPDTASAPALSRPEARAEADRTFRLCEALAAAGSPALRADYFLIGSTPAFQVASLLADHAAATHKPNTVRAADRRAATARVDRLKVRTRKVALPKGAGRRSPDQKALLAQRDFAAQVAAGHEHVIPTNATPNYCEPVRSETPEDLTAVSLLLGYRATHGVNPPPAYRALYGPPAPAADDRPVYGPPVLAFPLPLPLYGPPAPADTSDLRPVYGPIAPLTYGRTPAPRPSAPSAPWALSLWATILGA